MKSPKVVLGTNIYIRKLFSPGGRGDKLFGLFVSRKLDLYTSKRQLEELIGVVLTINEEGRRHIDENDFFALVAKLQKRAIFVPSKRQNKLSPDPDDDWIIGIAIKAKATHLISENPKDIRQDLIPKTLALTVWRVKEALDVWLPKK
jgi:putative PIN family toxin of toxin-antitoxin system